MSKPLTLSNKVDFIKYTRNNFQDVNRKPVNSSIEKDFWFSNAKFAKTTANLIHPDKNYRPMIGNQNYKNVSRPYDVSSKYRRTMDVFLTGREGEGNFAYRLSIKRRPEVQAQINDMIEQIPLSTPNRNQILDEMVDNLLKQIEQEEIKSGALGAVELNDLRKLKDGEAKDELIMKARLERIRHKLGQGVITALGMDRTTVDIADEVDGVIDEEDEVDVLEQEPDQLLVDAENETPMGTNVDDILTSIDFETSFQDEEQYTEYYDKYIEDLLEGGFQISDERKLKIAKRSNVVLQKLAKSISTVNADGTRRDAYKIIAGNMTPSSSEALEDMRKNSSRLTMLKNRNIEQYFKEMSGFFGVSPEVIKNIHIRKNTTTNIHSLILNKYYTNKALKRPLPSKDDRISKNFVLSLYALSETGSISPDGYLYKERPQQIGAGAGAGQGRFR